MQGSSDVLDRAMHALHILEEADDLGDGLRERVAQLLGDSRDLRAQLGANVALDEVIDVVESHQNAERLVAQVNGRVDEQLMRELHDRTVRAANVLARTALRAKPRNN